MTTGRRSFAFNPANQPMLDRRDAMARFRAASTTEERALAARSLRALDERHDAADSCDCSDPTCAACVTHLDGVIGPDLRKAGRWLGSDRVRAIREAEDDPTERLVMAETLIAAASSTGDDTPELVAGIRGASLDTLRAAYEQCPDPETERTDTMSDPESLARARMQRDAATAWTRPLDRPATADDQVRTDATERAYDNNQQWLERFRADGAEHDEKRIDLKDPKSGLPTFRVQPGDTEDGTPIEDAETKAKRRAQRRAENAWREPLALQDRKQLEIARLARETDDEVA